MQHNSQASTIDPSLLVLNAHSKASSYNPNITSNLDDVAIATGQAACTGDTDSDYVKPWRHINSNGYANDDFEPLAEVEFCSTQLQSASVGAENTRNHALDSTSHYRFLKPASAPEASILLQTSAPGPSSAPGLNYTSSQCRQNGSEWFPTLQDPNVASTPSFLLQKNLRTLPMQQRTLHESYQTLSALNHGFPSLLHNADYYALEPSQYDCLGQEYNAGEDPCEREESDSSSRPSLGQHEESTLKSPTSSATAPIAIPRRGSPETMVAVNSGHGLGYALPSHHENLSQGQDRKSRQTHYPESPDIVTGVESSWQQQQALRWRTGKTYGSTYPGLEGSSSIPYIHGNYCVSQSLDSATRGRSSCQIDDNLSRHNCPSAINIPQNIHYQGEKLLAFPSCFPSNMQDLSNSPPRQSIISSSPLNIPVLNDTRLPQRSRFSRNKSTRRSRSGCLKAIPKVGEDSLGSSPANAARGRRRGRLAPAAALAACQKRSDGDVCIRCKMMKQTCKGGLPCQGCQKNANAKSWKQPCHPAKFLDIVEAGPCNAVFQQSASIATIDGRGTVTLNYSGDIDVKVLIHRLHLLQFQYNIGVRQHCGSSYTIDLAKTVEIIENLDKTSELKVYRLDQLGRHRLPKGSDWLDCIVDYNPSVDEIGRSIESNDMPSENAYSYLPLDGTYPRRMNVDNEQNQSDILLAIQLCRIIVHRLEVNAIRVLQKTINDLPKNRSSEADLIHLAQQLSELLFSLRKRISWWAVFELGSSIGDDTKDTCTERVIMLAQTLYYWYFVVKKKLPAWTNPSSGQSSHRHADDDLPEDESKDGFDAWMAHGIPLIYKIKSPGSGPHPQYFAPY